VLWPVSKHHQDEKGIWLPGHDMVIITGIGGYRKMAARDHKDYAGSSDATYTWFDPPKKTPAGRTIPESATVRVHRRGAEDTIATVYWEEFAPHDLTDKRADFWNRLPKNQLEKCAEAKGLRKAFPGLGDVFTEEEMSQRLSDLTPGGREIVDDRGFSPSGRPLTYEAQHGSHEAAQKVLEAKLAGAMPLNTPDEPKASPSQPAERHSTSGKLPETAYHPDNVPPATKQEPWKYAGEITIDYSGDATFPRLTGDISELAGFFPKDLTMKRKDDFWHVFSEESERLKQVAVEHNFRITEIPAKAKAPQGGKATTAGRGGRTGASESAAPVVVKGTIESHTEKMTSKKQPMMSVLVKTAKGKIWYSVFDHDLFPFISKAKGREGEFYVKEGNYPTIVGFLKLAGREFTDGKIPAVQRSEQEPGKTLFGT
jgi:hypothetical protein